MNVPDFPLITKCRHENKLLKQLWDYIFLVRYIMQMLTKTFNKLTGHPSMNGRLLHGATLMSRTWTLIAKSFQRWIQNSNVTLKSCCSRTSDRWTKAWGSDTPTRALRPRWRTCWQASELLGNSRTLPSVTGIGEYSGMLFDIANYNLLLLKTILFQ